jgi:hypothetical protein
MTAEGDHESWRGGGGGSFEVFLPDLLQFSGETEESLFTSERILS